MSVSFFLGANTRRGFFFLPNELYDARAGERLFSVKGSPGCGKSTFMKIIADGLEKSGLFVERYYCSGDPSSLDAVRCPEAGVTYVDGTAPHVVDPDYTGACGSFVNLSGFCDRDALYKIRGDIIDVTAKYRSHYASAYAMLSQAGKTRDVMSDVSRNVKTVSAICKKARTLARRETVSGRKYNGQSVCRFTDAITRTNTQIFSGTFTDLCSRFIYIDDPFGYAPIYLYEFADECVRRGAYVMKCLSPLDPSDISHIILPDFQLALTTVPVSSDNVSTVRLASYFTGSTPQLKTVYKRLSSASACLVSSACSEISSAGELHDELERLYNPYVDFSGVVSLAEAHLNSIV